MTTDFSNFSFKSPTSYTVDWDKVNSVKDIKLILRSLGMVFSGDFEGFPLIGHLLIPIDLPPPKPNTTLEQ